MLVVSGFNILKGAKMMVGSTALRASVSRGVLTLANAGRYVRAGQPVNVTIYNPGGAKSARVRYRRTIGRVTNG